MGENRGDAYHQILEEEIQKVEETFGKVVQLLSLQTICPC